MNNKPVSRADSWVGSPEYTPTEPDRPPPRNPVAQNGLRNARRLSREFGDKVNEKRLYNKIFSKAAAGQEKDINKLRAIDNLAEDYKYSDIWGDQTMANNPRLGTMNKYVEMGLIKSKASSKQQGLPPVKDNPYKLGGVRNEPVQEYQLYTFKEIKPFFYVNLHDGEGFSGEDIIERKRKEAKALIMQLGQRRIDRQRTIDMLRSHKTQTHEKSALAEKKDFYEYLMMHGWERIRTLMHDAPFIVEDIYEELEGEMQQEYDFLVLDQAKEELGLEMPPLDEEDIPSEEQKNNMQQIQQRGYRANYYKQVFDLKVRKGRKFLEIDLADTKAIKNRLGMTTLSELVEMYIEYEKEGGLKQLYERIKQAMPGGQRTEKLMKKIKFVRDLETEYLSDQEKTRHGVSRTMTHNNGNDGYSQHSWDTEDEADRAQIYTFLPFWNVEIIDTADRKTKLLHQMLGVNIGIATQIYRITSAKTVDELVKLYRQNKGDELRNGLFTDQEIKILIDSGWTSPLMGKFNWVIAQLSEAALQLPKLMFEYPKARPDLKILEIEDVPGLPVAAYSALITSVLVNPNNVKGIRLDNLDLTSDIVQVLQFLVNSKEKRIIEVTINFNDLRDEGAYHLLQSSKQESPHTLKILRLERCNLTSQGGIYISGFLKEASYVHSYLKLQCLSLKGNKIGNIGFETLMFSIRGNTSLQYLDLSYNEVADINLSVVFEALRFNTALQILYIDGNRFNNNSILKLLEDPAKFTNNSLLILKIGTITALADHTAKLIRWPLTFMTKLRYCEIISPSVAPDDNDRITRAIQSFPHSTVIKVLAKDPSPGTYNLGDLLIEALHERTQYEENPAIQKVSNSPEKTELTRNGKSIFLPFEFESIVKKLADGQYGASTIEAVCYLLEIYFDYDMLLKEGITFLHKMALAGKSDAVSYMLKRNADPNITTSINYAEFPQATLLHLTVAVGSLSMIAETILSGANITAQDANGNTPLHYAASLGQLELCSFLVEKGCPPDIKNKKRMEPIHAGILSDDPEVLEYFLDMLNESHNPQITRDILEDTVARGLNSLMIAIENNSLDVFMYILNLNVDFNKGDAQGKTPIHWAIELGRLEMMENLIIKGASLRVKDHYGETPMYYAIRRGNLNLIEKLYSLGAALDVESAKGDTLLHTAAATDNVEVIFWLLGKGLSPGKKNAFAQYPKDIARSKVVRDLLPATDEPVKFDIYAGNPPSQSQYSEDGLVSGQYSSQRISGSKNLGSKQEYDSAAENDSQGMPYSNNDEENYSNNPLSAGAEGYSQQRSANAASRSGRIDSSPSLMNSRRKASGTGPIKPFQEESDPTETRDPRDTYLSGGNRGAVPRKSMTPMKDRLPTIKDRGNKSVNKGSNPFQDETRGGNRGGAPSYMNYLEEISKKENSEAHSKSYNLPLIGKQNAL